MELPDLHQYENETVMLRTRGEVHINDVLCEIAIETNSTVKLRIVNLTYTDPPITSAPYHLMWDVHNVSAKRVNESLERQWYKLKQTTDIKFETGVELEVRGAFCIKLTGKVAVSRHIKVS